MSSFEVPEGHSEPFLVVTPSDKSAWIIIATAFGLTFVLLFGIIRVCVRLTIAPPFGLDDIFQGCSTLIAIVQSSIILYAASLGLGKSKELLSPERLVQVQKLYYATMILFVLAHGLAKCSVLALLMRMTPKRKQLLVFKGTLVFLGIGTVAFALAFALQCSLSHPWLVVGEQCPGSFLRWQVYGGFDVFTEAGLFILATYLVWNIRLSQRNKAIVLVAFGLRLPIIVTIAFRLHTFDESGFTVNPTLLETLFIIWTQAELDFSCVAATIPSLRRFVSGLATYYGALDQKTENAGSSYAVRSNGGEFVMSPVASATKSTDREGHSTPQSDKAPPSNRSSCQKPKPTGRYGTTLEPTQNAGTSNNLDGQVPGVWNNHEGSTTAHVATHDANSDVSNDSQQ